MADTHPSNATKPAPGTVPVTPAQPKPADEIGGTDKPEPTRYGDWEIGGRCVDF